MDNETQAALITTLREIRDNQRLQPERHAESLELQRSQYKLAAEQFERACILQDRAEALQAKSAALMDNGRKIISIILPIVVALTFYLTWLIFRR